MESALAPVADLRYAAGMWLKVFHYPLRLLEAALREPEKGRCRDCGAGVHREDTICEDCYSDKQW